MRHRNDPQRTDAPRPTALVSAAVEALATQFFEPLAASDLLRDAWEGATAALVTAGRSLAPPPPEYPRDPSAAYATHDRTFPKLERLADGKVSLDDLATAAVEEVYISSNNGESSTGAASANRLILRNG